MSVTHLGVAEKAQLEVPVESEVIGVAADGGDDDDFTLLSLELLH